MQCEEVQCDKGGSETNGVELRHISRQPLELEEVKELYRFWTRVQQYNVIDYDKVHQL